jgi:ubiquitin-activating enzyme E1
VCSKFWSGTKRVPAPIVFDASDACHMGFVVSAANLRASNYGLQGHANVEVIKEIIGQMRIPEFKPKSSVKIAADESEMKKMSEQKPESSDEVGPMVQAITSALPAPASLAGYRVHPATFEKDDDTNFHMDFVTACSNLRARNYRIKEENKYQTKLIAGKIIPAIATTTALVAGLVVVELYKYIQKKPVEAYRSTFSNLAVPLFSFSEPNPPLFKEAPIKSGPWKWSLWDHIDIDAVGMTLQDLLDHFEEKFGLTINMLSYGSAIIYSFFGNKKELATRLQMPVADVCVRVSKTELPASARYIVLEASVNDADDNDVEIPYMRVKIAP